jgi:hypothetical protein
LWFAAKAPAPAAKKAAPAPAAPAASGNPEADKLKAQITEAGEKVRELKTSGAAKDDPAVAAAVQNLLDLKTKHKDLTGEEFPPKAKKSKKKKGGAKGTCLCLLCTHMLS